jgi:hypothetical protein
MRLIDADELKKELSKRLWFVSSPEHDAQEIMDIIDNAPTQVVSNEKINCPQDLNQYLICEPIFENTFSLEECESRKFYGDCYHCFASAIAKRDKQIRGDKHIHMSDYPDEYKSCKGCKYYSYGCFNGHPCINCHRNFKLVDEIREQKNDLWKDGALK